MSPGPWGLGGLCFFQCREPRLARKEGAALIVIIVLSDPRLILQGSQGEPILQMRRLRRLG